MALKSLLKKLKRLKDKLKKRTSKKEDRKPLTHEEQEYKEKVGQ